MGGQILEGALEDATAAGARREGNGDVGEGHDDLDALVGDGGTVTAEGSIGAVKDGRVARGLDVQPPFPVGKVAIVAALLEMGLVDVEVEAMPREEGALMICLVSCVPRGSGCL